MIKPIDYPVDYNKLKGAIRKSLTYGKRNDFNVIFPELAEKVANMDLTPVYNVPMSMIVKPTDVPFLSAFFQGESIVWMTQSKQYLPILFIKSSAIDDEAQQLLEDMRTHLTENPSIDKVNTMAKIIGKYPCYTAVVVSYESLDPKNFGKINCEIMCKANTVTIKQDTRNYDVE